MPWLATLDARAKTWPMPVHWLYLGAKWYLIAGGVIVIIGLAATELREHRVGLGTGVLATLVFATIKGIALAAKRQR